MERKNYLDNIRWFTVVLVMVYHVFYMFNASGVLGGIGSFGENQWQDAYLYFVYPWFMILLFAVAGMSARYSLEKTGGKAFIKARTQKLLVPSTLGLLALHWIVGVFYMKLGGGVEGIPAPVLYIIAALSGGGPMWFAHLLWLYSLLLVLIRKIDKGQKLLNLCAKTPCAVLFLLALLIWGGSFVLNMPTITVYRFGVYFVAFLLGYFVLSHDEVQLKIEKTAPFVFPLALAMGAGFVFLFWGQNYTEGAVLKHWYTNLYAWIAVLAALGIGKKFFDKRTAFTAYMAKSSFGFYVLHYICVVFPCYLLQQAHESSKLPVWAVYVLGIIIALAATPAFYEVVRRIPIVRYLVLGIKKAKPKAESGNAEAR